MSALLQTLLYTAGTLLAGTAISWVFIALENASKKNQ